jgi:hypothetical protein
MNKDGEEVEFQTQGSRDDAVLQHQEISPVHNQY